MRSFRRITAKNPSFDELDAISKKEKDMQDAAFKPVLESAIAKFKAKGYDFTGDTDGVFIAEIPFKDLINGMRLKRFSDGTGRIENLLASARAASGMTAVNSRSINGSGVTIAVIEQNGKYSRDTAKTPDLPLANITQDPIYVCAYPDDHATQVVGILRSTNALNPGVAQGSTLWVGGSCGGYQDQMIDRAQYSVNNVGAKVVNFSDGCKVT